MTSLLNFRLPARALLLLWFLNTFPVPVSYALLAVLVGGAIFFFICLGIGGPLWDRWMQVLRLLTRRKRGG